MVLQYGDWSIVQELGKGSFGTVYEIEKSEFGYVYRAALKVIHIPQGVADVEQVRSLGMSENDITEYYQDIVTDCIREIVLMSQMQGHTNVVNYQAHEVRRQENGVGWDILIQMELLTPLNQYMASHAMTRKDVVILGISVCKALERCQKLGIIHRDIKPANIFVSDQGDFKLGDFGIARTAERTMSGMSRKGTYTYMAPEVYQGKAYNHRVDIYSLGLVLYRLLNNNREPFLPPYPQKIRYQDQEQAMIRRMRGDRLPPPGEERGKLAEIVLKACSFDPKDRYADPKEMREELEELLKDEEERKKTAAAEQTEPVDPQPTDEEGKQPEEKSEPTAPHSEETLQETVEDGTVTLFNQTAKDETVFLWDEKDKSVEGQEELLEEDTQVVQRTEEEDRVAEQPKSWKKKVLIACAAVLVLVCGYFGFYRLTTVAVPDVMNLSVAEAEELFKENGLILEEGESVYSEEADKGKIASCEREGKRAKKGAVLSVAVSLGKQTEVKDYTGKQADKVKKSLTKRGITVKEKKQYSLKYDKGVIVKQSSEKGAKLAEGDTMTLTVSKGPKSVKLEQFTGMSQKDAVKKAEKLGLKVKTSEAFSSIAQKGNVAEQSPKAGETAQGGDTITFTISKGAEQVKVPNLMGKTRAEAESALKAAGLSVGSVTTSYSSYAYGNVCGQGKTAGSQADKGSAVNFTTSVGAKPVYTPKYTPKSSYTPKKSSGITKKSGAKADAKASDFGL